MSCCSHILCHSLLSDAEQIDKLSVVPGRKKYTMLDSIIYLLLSLEASLHTSRLFIYLLLRPLYSKRVSASPTIFHHLCRYCDLSFSISLHLCLFGCGPQSSSGSSKRASSLPVRSLSIRSSNLFFYSHLSSSFYLTFSIFKPITLLYISVVML